MNKENCILNNLKTVGATRENPKFATLSLFIDGNEDDHYIEEKFKVVWSNVPEFGYKKWQVVIVETEPGKYQDLMWNGNIWEVFTYFESPSANWADYRDDKYNKLEKTPSWFTKRSKIDYDKFKKSIGVTD